MNHRLYKKIEAFVRVVLATVLGVTALPVLPAAAQDAAPPVLILPIDRATFLPGAYFDFRVEVHAAEMPEDFAVTINGEDASAFFGAEPNQESWTFGKEEETPSQSVIWRQVMLPEPGLYTVEVTAGGATTSVDWYARQPAAGAGARNVILFVGDGMTIPQLTAARIASRGNTQGKTNGYFAIDQMETIGLIQTSSVDSIMADSANTASALNTGHKSSVNALGVYADTSPDTLDDPRQETLAEILKRTRGMSIGIVTTAGWTDATPAAVFGHTRRRGDRDFLAASPLDEGLLPEVIMGGDGRYMLPEAVAGGRRKDGRNMFDEYEAAGYTVVTTATELQNAMDAGTPERLLGIFHSGDMNVWLDRNVYTDNLGDFPDQPGLVDMTLSALEILGQNENGFYLMVEAGSIDKQMHPLDQERALSDLIEMDNAVAAAIEWAAVNAPDTLIVVTADHGHGYEVYGTVDVKQFNSAADDAGKRKAIRIYDAAGFPTYEDADGDFFPDTWDVSIVFAGVVNNHPDYTEDFQVSPTPRVPAIADADGNYVDNPDDDPNGILLTGNLPLASSTGVHTLQDAPVFASGPGAAFFGRVMDNTEIFFGMAAALGVDPLAEDGMAASMDTESACAGIVFNSRCYTR
ncbi:MAG TPA: alkaline phosphatase [Chloroflexi bacterium]|nr:alkaline phosphatase [Chloroflexota bacterium]HHW86676.1 alkaline phosphatase [Chloroflexota bacterium]